MTSTDASPSTSIQMPEAGTVDMKLRFGVVSESVPEGQAWLEHARRAEGPGQLRELEVVLDADPAAWGWQDEGGMRVCEKKLGS